MALFPSLWQQNRFQVLEKLTKLVCRISLLHLAPTNSAGLAAPTTSPVVLTPYEYWRFRFETSYRLTVNLFLPRPKYGLLLGMSHDLGV